MTNSPTPVGRRVQSPDRPGVAARFPAWARAWSDAAYVAVHGSEAYGLADEASDVDLKGAYIPPRAALLGYRDPPPEHLEFAPDPQPPGRLPGPHDAALYSLQKLCRLGAACNPNAVEMLFVEEHHVVKMTALGERIRALGPRFLSRRARQTFGEYARGQLKRLEQHRRWLRDPPAGPPTRAAFGLPEHGLVPPEQRDAAERAVAAVQARWQLDLEGLLPHQAIALQARVSDYLADIAAAVGYVGARGVDDLRFVAAARQAGIGGDILEALRRERRFTAAVREWAQYREWQRTRNPRRAALERAHGYDCHLDDTEFLTECGWRRYDGIENGVRLATIDRRTGALEFQFPTERVSAPYSGPIAICRARHSECAVTLNHRMLVSPAHRSRVTRYSTSYDARTASWQILPLQELLSGRRSHFHVRASPAPTTCPAPICDEVLTLVGCYASEGCVGKRRQDGSASVLRISQAAGGRLIPHLERIRRAWPASVRRFAYLHRDRWRAKECQEVVYTVADRSLAREVEAWCGTGSANKRLPPWILTLSAQQADHLLDVLLAGDGTLRRRYRVYYTASPRLADDVQSLCLIAGRSSEIWGPYGGVFQVYVGDRTAAIPFVLRGGSSPDVAIEEVHDRRIVCFTVPNEVLVTRRNGRVAIHGNTKHATHLVRLMRTGRDLVVDGVMRVYRPDREELLAIRRGAWRYEDLVADVAARGAEADAAIREGRSPLPVAPDEAAINAECVALTDAFAGETGTRG